jgi:hypothetical protein
MSRSASPHRGSGAKLWRSEKRVGQQGRVHSKIAAICDGGLLWKALLGGFVLRGSFLKCGTGYGIAIEAADSTDRDDEVTQTVKLFPELLDLLGPKSRRVQFVTHMSICYGNRRVRPTHPPTLLLMSGKAVPPVSL